VELENILTVLVQQTFINPFHNIENFTDCGEKFNKDGIEVAPVSTK